ncbi:type IX secretion system outer membrane channel protein PorV [Salinimicrobium soli]|uniref:type IX secretion system outer membrane channel protein PorV n=1 Tax=Salinimicrobium soli TaxID=1254399 RepID=UPI003AAE6B1E
MNIKNILLGLGFGIIGLQASSQELVRPVITGAPFLQIVPDARAGGMAEIGVASLPDSYSQFHNPAKFLFFGEETSGIGLSYIPQFQGYANDIFHANAAYYQQLNERSVMSGSLTYFSFGRVEVEEEIGGEVINQGSFVPNEMAFDLSYSLKMSENYGMSVSGRYIRSNIINNRSKESVEYRAANAVAVDISGYYVSANPGDRENMWSLGFNFKNLGSKLTYSDEEEVRYPLPSFMKIGGGYHIMSGRNDVLSFYGEAMKYLVTSTNDNGELSDDSAVAGWFRSFTDAPDGFSEEIKEVIFSVGSEYNFNKVLSLRTGFITQNRDKGNLNHLTFGGGINYERFNFDVAYQNPLGSNSGFQRNDVFKLSLSIDLNYNSPSQQKANPVVSLR